MNTEAKVGIFVVVSLLVLGATAYFIRTAQNAYRPTCPDQS